MLRPRLCARGGGDSSHAASGCVGRGRYWRQAGRADCHSQRVADVGRKEHAELGSCIHLGAEMAVAVAGEAVRVVDLKKEAREVCREGGGPGASDLFGPSAGHSVGAHHGGGAVPLAMAGTRRRVARKQIQRLAMCPRATVEGDEECASSPVFLAVSERQKHHCVALLQRAREGKVRAPICVSCLDDRHPWVLLVNTVATLCRVLFPSVALNSEPGQQHPHEELVERAPLFAVTGCVCSEGWLAALNRLAHQMWTTTRQRRSLWFLVPERTVALTDELLVMCASRRVVARAHAVSKDRMEKDKEQQRLQFNSALENDDEERRRPECSNGKISGEEIEDLDPGSFCGDRSRDWRSIQRRPLSVRIF